MFDAGSASDGALQRSHGVARLRFRSDSDDAGHGRTRIHERYAAAPARLLTPRAIGTAPEAVLANTAGGVAGGDSFRIDVVCEAGADATVTGQAAEKIYRALDAPARIRTRIELEAGATLEWLPQETILFDGAQLDRAIDVSIAPDARLLMTEMTVFGRQAHGERFDAGRFIDRWRIDRDGQPVWRDALRVTGGEATLSAAAGLANARAVATLIYAAPDAPDALEELRAIMDAADAGAGATVVRGLIFARMLGTEAGALKAALAKVVGAFRAYALGRPASAPRVWLC